MDALKVLVNFVFMCKNTSWMGEPYINLIVCRVICENLTANGLVLGQDMIKNENKENNNYTGFGEASHEM